MTSTSQDRRLGVNAGMAFKVPCVAATTGNITLSGQQTIDGVAVVTGDRVLVKDQSTGTQNGIYVCDTGDWTRDIDADGTYDFAQGTLVLAAQGTVNGGVIFRLTTADPVIGTSSLAFSAVFNTATVSTFIQTLLDDTTAAQARTTLGATASGLITGGDLTIGTGKIAGRTTAATGAIEALTLTQVLDLIGSAAQGDLLYRGASSWERLGAGTSGQLLTTAGPGSNPSWTDEKVVKVIEATPIASVVTCSTAIPVDDTIPQNTEGNQVITVTITPSNAANRLRIEFNNGYTHFSGVGYVISALFQDSTANALAANGTYGSGGTLSLVHEMAAGTTSATTFKIRVGGTVTAYINGDSVGARLFGGVSAARLRVTEIT